MSPPFLFILLLSIILPSLDASPFDPDAAGWNGPGATSILDDEDTLSWLMRKVERKMEESEVKGADGIPVRAAGNI